MNITAIPDREAASLLGVTYETIRNAAKRGDLIRLPRAGLVQYVAKEQVELFKGKKQVRLSALNKNELKTWGEIEELIKGSPASAPSATYASITVGAPDKTALEWMKESGYGYKMTPTSTGEVIFQPALADETDNKISPSLGIILVILLGLVTYFFVKEQPLKSDIGQSLAYFLSQIDVQKEDLASNQPKVRDALLAHPRETQQIKHILEREKLLPLVA